MDSRRLEIILAAVFLMLIAAVIIVSAVNAERIDTPVVTADVSARTTVKSASPANTPKININTATEEELQKIPGIGPSTASKIVQYRIENGAFSRIYDIVNVAGMGDRKFDSIKDYITVE